MTTAATDQRSNLPFSVVAKPTGAACNLDCTYCFFLSKDLLYNVASQQMNLEDLETYVRRFLQGQPDGPVTFLWQGGEPTLRGLDFFKTAVKLAKRYARPGQKVEHALQTNGTLLNDDWGQFLAQEDFLVGVSIDGPAAVHDAYRVNKAGRGTHKQVVRGWDVLGRHGVRRNILCTIHQANQDYPREVYTYFRDELKAEFIQFIPIVERVPAAKLALAEAGWRSSNGQRFLYQQDGHAVTSRSANPQKYGEFLASVFELWRQSDVGKVFVQDFDAALSAMFGQYSICVHAPECGNNLAIEFNGDVYSCDHWVEPDWKLGNIKDASFAEIINSSRQNEFGLKKSAQLTEQCRNCSVLRLCQGGCPKDRFVTNASGENGQSYLCPGYYKFYSSIKPDLVAMTRMLRAGVAPMEIMNPQVREKYLPKTAIKHD